MSDEREDVSKIQRTPWDDPRTLASYERWADPETARIATIALEMANVGTGSVVLDVGAGTGALAVQAAERGCRVVAVDSAGSMVERSRQRLSRYPDCTARVMDFAKLEFDDDRFDSAFGVLSVTLSPDCEAAIAQMVRVVRPGGVVCVIDWATLAGSPGIPILMRALGRLDGFATPELPPVGRPTPDAVAQLLSTAGCIDVFAQTAEAVAVLPSPEDFFDDYLPVFAGLPWLQDLSSSQRDALRTLLAEEVDAAVRPGSPTLRVQIAVGFVPEVQPGR